MNTMLTILFLAADQTLTQSGSIGVAMAQYFLAFAAFCSLGYGILEIVFRKSLEHLGYGILGAVAAACAIGIINFLFQGQAHLTSSGNVGMFLFLWR